MPNNFKLRGDYYVSKAGSDSNDGLTPETPKRTIQSALTAAASGQTIIVGSGVYAETLSKTINTLIFRADGYVVLDAASIANKTVTITNPGDLRFFGFEIRNYTSFSCGGLGFTSAIFNSCVFKNTTTVFIGNGLATKTFTNNIFINCDLTNADAHILDSCTLINCRIGISTSSPNPYTLRSTYINQGCICVMTNSTSNNYNNIQGLIVIPAASTVTTGVYQDAYGRYYDLSIATSTGDGSIGNPLGRPYTNGAAFNFATHRILYPTINANSVSTDPGFNNILKQDFSLQSSSYHVGRASDFISNIGGTYVATRLNASGSTFSGSNATVDNLVFSSFSDYVISGSAVTGSVTSAPIFISSSAKVIQEIDYNGLLAFNKDTTAPTGSNVNVPDVLTYTSASNQPGANPDRLTYYMRWTTGSSQPVSDAQWENGGLWPAGSFNTFEWNTKPSVDFLGRGNGDQNFNIVNTPTFVKATWIQLRLSLRNNYLI